MDEVVGLVLMMQEEDDIADTIYQSGPTLPGKRFAAEFIERRNADAANGAFNSAAAAASAATAAAATPVVSSKGTGNNSSGNEASRLHPAASQDSLGYKVVKKKGKGGKA